MEVDARLLPVPLHRALRYVSHGGNFPKRKSAKELQVDHLREGRLCFAQFFEHFADARQLSVIYRILSSVRVERGQLEQTTALWGVPFSRPIYVESPFSFRNGTIIDASHLFAALGIGDSRARNWQSSRHVRKHQPDILNTLRFSLAETKAANTN